MYVCVHNGTVYIYSRISGEKKAKGRRDSMFSARHSIVGFLCAHKAHKQDRDEERERERGGKTCEAAGKQHQLLNILFVFHIKSHSFSSTFLV